MKYGRKYEEPAGTATLTSGYNLPCDYVIYTVGPIVYDRLHDKLCQDLQNCYEIAWKTVKAFMEEHGDCPERIIFNVFKDSDWDIYEKILALP